MYSVTKIQMIPDFLSSSETIQAKTQWRDIFKILEENNL